MTYGWAFLIVLIVISSLVYFGVLDPDAWFPDKVELSNELQVTDIAVDENSITLILRNNVGKDITGLYLNVTECDNGAGSSSDAIAIPAGKTKKVNLHCVHDYEVGTKLDSNIDATWNTRTPAKGEDFEFSHKVTGLMKTTVNKGSMDTVLKIERMNSIIPYQYQWFNYTVNVSCLGDDCGEINVSLDPPADNYIWSSIGVVHTGGPFPWSYIMGYRFSPTYNMFITEICKYTGQAVPVQIYNSSYAKLDEKTITGGIGWECEELDYPLPIFADQDYFVVTPLQGLDGYYHDSASLPRTINEVYINHTVYQSTAGTVFTGQYTYEVHMYGMTDIGVVSGNKTGLVSTIEGDVPFYTNDTNPRTITLNSGESQLVTFWVNSTGFNNSVHEFFAFANITSNMSISNETDHINLTIT